MMIPDYHLPFTFGYQIRARAGLRVENHDPVPTLSVPVRKLLKSLVSISLRFLSRISRGLCGASINKIISSFIKNMYLSFCGIFDFLAF